MARFVSTTMFPASVEDGDLGDPRGAIELAVAPHTDETSRPVARTVPCSRCGLLLLLRAPESSASRG